MDVNKEADPGSAGKRKRASIDDETDDVAIKPKHGRSSESLGKAAKRDVKGVAAKNRAKDGGEEAAARKIGNVQKDLALGGEVDASDEAFLDGQFEVHDDDEA